MHYANAVRPSDFKLIDDTAAKLGDETLTNPSKSLMNGFTRSRSTFANCAEYIGVTVE